MEWEQGKRRLQAWWSSRRRRKDTWLILLLAGLLLLVIAMPAGEEKREEQDQEQEETGLLDAGWTQESYVHTLEDRLERTLEQVQGVGDASVMITLSSTAENVVEKDREIHSESSLASSGAGTDRSSSSSETAVYAGEGGEETPYVSKQLSPRIQGVLVVAGGGDDPVVRREITEAVQALFGVDTHKIKVMKRN